MTFQDRLRRWANGSQNCNKIRKAMVAACLRIGLRSGIIVQTEKKSRHNVAYRVTMLSLTGTTNLPGLRGNLQ
jgi:hypothetical protein